MYCQEERGLSCDSCYEIAREYCEPINIHPDFIPGGYSPIYLHIIDKFDSRKTQAVEINGDGSFDIDLSLLPDNYLNPYAGKFELYLSLDEDGTLIVPMTFNGTEYNCLILTIAISQCDYLYVQEGYVECGYVE